MGLFDKKIKKSALLEEEIEKEVFDAVVIPKSLGSYKSSILYFVLNTILELGDENDYKLILEMSGKSFFIEIMEILFNENVLKNDDLELIIKNLNKVLSAYKLGKAQFFIYEEEKVIKIYHYYSIFKKYFPNMNDYFLLSFYKLFIEKLLEKDVKIKEEEQKNEITIFKITF